MNRILEMIFPEFKLLERREPASDRKEDQQGPSTSTLLFIDLTFLATLLALSLCDQTPALLGAQVLAFLIYSIVFDSHASGK